MQPHPAPDAAGHAAEVARIRRSYEQRDSGSDPGLYTYRNRAYVFYIQIVEWAVLDSLRRAAVDIEGCTALEVGCGSGYFVNRLVEFGAGSAMGIDLMAERIAAARSRYPAHRFERADGAALPLEDGSFDLVTQFTCLSSVLDPGLRVQIAAEMWRVLRPGGAILSYDLRVPTAAVRLMRWAGRRRGGRGAGEPQTPTAGVSKEELGRLFPEGAVSYSPTGLAFGLCRVANRSPALARALAQLPALREHAIGVVVKPTSAPRQ